MKLPACLVLGFSLATTGAFGENRGMVMESQFRLNRGFVIDSGIPTIVGILPLDAGIVTSDCVISPRYPIGIVTDFDHRIWIIDLSASPPQLVPGPNPFPISARGRTLASTRDGLFVVACGGLSGNTVSVVNMDYWVEQSTFDLQGECTAVDICRDGSVLLSSVNTGTVRKLVLDAAGTLSDTGESLSGLLAAGTVKCSPDGGSGVVFDNASNKMISFRTSGMTPVDERTLPTWGVSGAMATDGSRFYARTHGGTVEAYAYDQATALFGETPIYSLELGSGGSSGIALDPTGTKLYVPLHFSLRIVDAATGADVQSIFEEQLLYPSGICFRPAGDTACTLGDACDDRNPCTDDACDAGTGLCAHAPNDASSCSDGNACTQLDLCRGGSCVSSDPVSCSDPCIGGCCTVGVCDPSTGGCVDAPRDCDDHNPCTDDSCDANGECAHVPSPAYTSCDDHDACTGYYDVCDGYGYCLYDPPQCDDFIVCTVDGCDPVIGCTNFPAPFGTSCDSDGNPCNGRQVCDENLACVPAPPPDCYDGNPCTSDICDIQLGCAHTWEPAYTDCDNANFCDGDDFCDGFGNCNSSGSPCLPSFNPCAIEVCDPVVGCMEKILPAGFPCSDGNPCNGEEVCDGNRACVPGDGGPPVCPEDANSCTTAICEPYYGCGFTDNANPCDDGNACTSGDVCGGGSCHGGSGVICAALDQCHSAGACDPASGACSNPAKPDGTTCNDGDRCTTGESCEAGACTPASSGLNEPNPRTNGYYKRLCHGPHSGDELTDADALCVASVAQTFVGISTVADLCAELDPSQPNNDACDRTDDDLMVLALNVCRSRVCTAQSIDSQCGGNAHVGQSLAESDAILGSTSRDPSTCAHAKCLDEEINIGRALELNTLLLRREGSAIRLDWHPPYLDDGTGHPSKYHVWRRTQGSLAPFVQIGITTDPTFLDTAAGIGAYQYEVTPVMN